MRFTVTGHSTLFVETRGPTILVDPWFAGSCYWRSWWHFPPSDTTDPGWLAPDYLYVTHDHFDHFHYPTIRRLDRSTKVLVPRFGVDFMVDEFRRLGFDDVTEIPHGDALDVGDGVQIASFQYGFDDTLLVVADGDQVIWDMNDCKIRGRPLRKAIERFGRPSVVLKSHSFAQGYPHCYEAEDPADLERITRQTFVDDFTSAMDEIRPRFAVPFASMVGFLHPESFRCNEFFVTPPQMQAAYEAERPDSPTEVVPMAPGDSWDSEQGFTLDDFDWYADRDAHLAELADIVEPAIVRSQHEESERTLTFDEFEEFFSAFVTALPPLTGRLAIKHPIVFAPRDVPGSPFWVVDAPGKRVYETANAPEDRANVIEIDRGVLADAIANKVVHYIQISMRFHTTLRAGRLGDDLAFWGLLGLYELGYFPLHRSVRPRVLRAGWRRRTEAAQMVRAVFGGDGSFIDRMSGQLASESDGRNAEPAPTGSGRAR